MPEPPTRSSARADLCVAVPFAFILRILVLFSSVRVIDMADAIHDGRMPVEGETIVTSPADETPGDSGGGAGGQFAVCPETAACIGVLESLVTEGKIQADDRVVIFNTGAVQKYVEAMRCELPTINAASPPDWKAFHPGPSQS